MLAGLAVVERLHEAGQRLPFAVEVVAFADEEGARFTTAYLGSAAWCGAFDASWLELRDSDGVTVAEAIRAAGSDVGAIATAARPPERLIGYVEAHIEQGPLLEAEGLAVGVVSAIAGQTRARLTFTGQAGHAGTVPMALRRDVLAAAAETILAVEEIGRSRDGLVATVGMVAAEPGAGNVVPGRAVITVDVRHADDRVRETAVGEVRARADAAAAARGVALEWETLQEDGAVAMAPDLTGALEGAVAATGIPVRCLSSGAGHDAVIISRVAPVAMLFVRCAGGVSHNPAEAVAEEDVAVCLDVLERLLHRLG